MDYRRELSGVENEIARLQKEAERLRIERRKQERTNGVPVNQYGTPMPILCEWCGKRRAAYRQERADEKTTYLNGVHTTTYTAKYVYCCVALWYRHAGKLLCESCYKTDVEWNYEWQHDENRGC